MNDHSKESSQLDLDAIRQRIEAATPGPWAAHDDGLVWPEGRMGDPVSGSEQPADAEFIAAARFDIPALLAEVVRLRALADDPTTNPYWRLRSQRAEEALAERDQQYDEACRVLANVRESLELVGQNFDKHDATIDRVRALATEWRQATGWRISEVIGEELLAALDSP